MQKSSSIFALARNPPPQTTGKTPLSPAQIAVLVRKPRELISADDRLYTRVGELTTMRSAYRELVAASPDREKNERVLRQLAAKIATKELEVREATQHRDRCRVPYAAALTEHLDPLHVESVRQCSWLLDQFNAQLAIQAAVIAELSHAAVQRPRFPAAARALVGALRQMLQRQ
jgi:hypothetical protein